MPPLGRGKTIAFGIILRSKTQIDASIEQLPGKGGLAAKTVYGPLRGGVERIMKPKQSVPGADNVERDGQAEMLRQGYLRLENFYLERLGTAAQPIQATFTEHHHLRMRQKARQALQLHAGISLIGRGPRVHAGGIKRTFARLESVGTAQHFGGQANNGFARRSIKAVSVEVEHRKGVNE